MKKQLSLAVLLFLTAATAQKPKDQWKEYIFPRDKFAITAPSMPILHSDPQNADVRIYSVQVDSGTRLAIRVADWKIDCEAKLRQLKGDGPVEKEISLAGVPGLESTVKAAGDPNILVTERFYCLKDQVFVLSIGYPATQAKPPAVGRILNSFRFLGA